jgi:mycothiol system anti-sigma-R factor
VDEHVHDLDHVHDEPHAEECVESLESLYVFLDGELTAERRTAIRSHLDGCLDCYGAYDFEAELRLVVSTSCREEVPDELRARVAEALHRLQEG